mmetsp:Transcript_17544/g.21156  ORF Transcript_17544/g.21156 Transcript_17544/m.21156 type:complete len:141 (+) Transcript_17544:3-425(+)|eukprot:jgi/Bigna1/81327/fgenesh1_pg.79_\
MGVCGSTELSQLPTEVQQALDKFAETYSPEMPLVFMITTSTPVFQFQGDAKVLNSSILPQCRKVMESLQIPIKEKKTMERGPFSEITMDVTVKPWNHLSLIRCAVLESLADDGEWKILSHNATAGNRHTYLLQREKLSTK